MLENHLQVDQSSGSKRGKFPTQKKVSTPRNNEIEHGVSTGYT